MAEKPRTAGRTMKNTKITLLVITLALLVAGYISSYYLVSQDQEKTTGYLREANALKMLSQGIVNHSTQAAAGVLESYPLLAEDRSEFDLALGNLKNGSPKVGLPPSEAPQQVLLNRISAEWAETREHVDKILNNRDVLLTKSDASGDLGITLSAIQQENAKVVADLLRLGIPASVVVRAQHQGQLVERMSRSIDKVLDTGGSKNLIDNFNRDRAAFVQILEALTQGDRDLQIPAAGTPELRASLGKIEELFRTVSTSTNEIFTRAPELVEIRLAAQAINLNADGLTARLSELVKRYEDEAGGGLASPLIGLGCALGAFLVMLILGVLLSRQARRSVTETREQN